MKSIDKFWLGWFVITFGSFLSMEVYQLVTGHPERTLSAAIWRLEAWQPGQPFWQWTAGHFLFMGVFTLLIFWLFFHFGFHLFT